VLQKSVRWEGNTVFFDPNPGALYPAVHDLAERALAAAKAVRPFQPSRRRDGAAR
jgi:CRISPR-associated protein Cmr2